MGKKILHVSLNIEAVLAKTDDKLRGLLEIDKTPMTGREVRCFLESEKAQGYEWFCGCDNRLASGSCGGHVTN